MVNLRHEQINDDVQFVTSIDIEFVSIRNTIYINGRFVQYGSSPAEFKFETSRGRRKTEKMISWLKNVSGRRSLKEIETGLKNRNYLSVDEIIARHHEDDVTAAHFCHQLMNVLDKVGHVGKSKELDKLALMEIM